MTSPFAVAANVGLLLFWALFAKKKWRLIVPLLALGCAYRIIPAVFGLHLFAGYDLTTGPGRLKVMSWNVHGMGIFDRPPDRTTDDRIIAQIRAEAPDILVLPEFYTVYNNSLKPYSTHIMDECGYKEFRFRYDNTIGAKIFLGTALFSRYPVSNDHVYALHTRHDGDVDVQLMRADVTLPGGKKLRVFTTHLQSFTLSDKEKDYLEEVSNRDSGLAISKSRSFIRRFGGAYLKRAIQADSAAAIIAESPYPIVLCGDFNDLPASYTYERMKGKLNDAFAERGFGIGRTYNMLSPTLRIDYVFYDPAALKLIGFRSQYSTLSDHNPVIANFEVRP